MITDGSIDRTRRASAGSAVVARPDGPGDRVRRILLNGLGVVAVASGLAQTLPDPVPVAAVATAVAALVAWVVVSALPRRRAASRTALALQLVMLLGGLVATIGISTVAITLPVVAIVMLLAQPVRPILLGLAAATGAAAAIGAAALVVPVPLPDLALALGGVVLGVVIGYARRLGRQGEERERLLAEERERGRVARERSAALDERAALARDLHDTLAHALGGLVIQLDATEALTEAGRLDEAADRVRRARALAADGLADARRAVQALRGDGPADGATDDAGSADGGTASGPGRATATRPAAALAGELDALVRSAADLGTAVGARIDPAPDWLDAAAAEAIRRTLQESLTNARKHAPRAPVEVGLLARGGDGPGAVGDAVELTVSNAMRAGVGPIGSASADTGDPADTARAASPDARQEEPMTTDRLASTGGGHGLAGMRERLAAVPGGSLRVERAPDRFRIVARVERADRA